ncbi:MAG: VWA domain-containing protein [Thermoguttaceae bacterium]|nr:VWA domain-containing protein [Thermoguttaceae bacterium]
MTLLQPWILLTLPLALAPLVLYWLRRRWTERRSWAAMDILLQAYKTVEPKQKQSDVVQLILQTALILLAVVLVAQPVFYVPQQTEVSNSPSIAPAELHSVYVIVYDTSTNAPAYFKAGFEQLGDDVRFDVSTPDAANPTTAQNADILILHGIESVPQWLAKVIENRGTDRRPVWIFAPHCLDDSSRRMLQDVLPPLAGKPSKTARPYETLNPRSLLWQAPDFEPLAGKPVPFPSLVNSVYESTDGWSAAFLDSSTILSRDGVWAFSSAVDGTQSAWPMSDLWIPLLDRVASVSLSSCELRVASCDGEAPFPFRATARLPKNAPDGRLRTSSLSRLLAIAGLVILVTLFCRFGRKPSRYSQRERRWGWVCYVASCVILFVMAIQATFTPVVWVKPSILFLVDDSQSMNLPQQSGYAQTRKQAMVQWVDKNTDSLEKLLQNYRLFESSFRSPDAVAEITSAADWKSTLEQRTADALTSDPKGALAHSVETLSSQIDRQTLSAAFILSDGAAVGQPAPDSEQVLNNQRQSGVNPKVFALALGQDKPIPNAGIENVKLDSVLFAGHENELEFQLRADGLQGKTVKVELIEKEHRSSEPRVIGSKEVKIPSPHFVADLSFKIVPPKPGEYEYTLKIVNRDDEFIQADNAVTRQAEAEERQIRVLLVSGSPNWEFRYLRNLLARTGMVKLSVVLQNASKEYVKEDSCALESFPNSAESLNEFDALIFINPVLDWLNAQQRDAIRVLQVASNELREDSVNKAMIFYWNAQTDFAPVAALDGRLIPFDVSAASAPSGKIRNSVTISPLGQTKSWLDLSSKDKFDWSTLPPLGAVVSVKQLKANVQTLLTTADNASPLLTVHDVGNVRVATVLTDSLWRWRQGAGEAIYNQFQINLVRAMVKPSADNRVEKPVEDAAVPEEWRNTSANSAALSELCKPTGGLVFRPTDSQSVLDAIRPDASRVRVVRPPVAIWNQFWLLAILLAVLLFDWSRLYLKKE